MLADSSGKAMKTNELIQPAQGAVGVTPAASRLPQSPQAGNLDSFARLAGADVSMEGPSGLTQAYAVFEIDPKTEQLHVMIVDDKGQVMRVIPSGSVSEMVESMARYRV